MGRVRKGQWFGNKSREQEHLYHPPVQWYMIREGNQPPFMRAAGNTVLGGKPGFPQNKVTGVFREECRCRVFFLTTEQYGDMDLVMKFDL